VLGKLNLRNVIHSQLASSGLSAPLSLSSSFLPHFVILSLSLVILSLFLLLFKGHGLVTSFFCH
jgi:hypothetical protein